MNIYDYINAGEIAAYIETLPSNSVQYIGAGLFPNKQQSGTDISWLRGGGGLPITIQPSNYDAKASLRERTGFGKQATEMAFFREANRIGEKDRQQLQLLLNQNLGMAQPIISRLFDDTANIVNGVEAQAEYMRMQLLQYGKFTVQSFNAEAKYTYDYNMAEDSQYTAAAPWTAHAESNPVADIIASLDDVETRTGVRPTRMILNRETYNDMVSSHSIKKALMIGVTGSWQDFMVMNTQAEQFIAQQTGIQIAVYSKKIAQFDNSDLAPTPENVQHLKLIDDGKVVLLPPNNVGSTWHGTTPEAFDLANGGTDAQVSVLTNGPTIMTYKEPHPVNVVTVVSAVMVPSFEGIDHVGVLDVSA